MLIGVVRGSAVTAMKIIYVCSPYRGDVRNNIIRAQRICRMAALAGNTVICPHLYYPSFLDDGNEKERELGLSSAICLLSLADEVWVASGTISEGMKAEIAKAEELKIPIKIVDDIAPTYSDGYTE